MRWVMRKAASVCVDGWAGRREHACLVIGETRTKYRVEMRCSAQLPGRLGFVVEGATAMVPKTAVRFEERAVGDAG